MTAQGFGDPSLNSALVSGLNTIMAQYFRYAPGALKQLSAQRGKVLKITCTAPTIECWLVIEESGPRFVAYCEEHADCQIKGSLPNLIAIALTKPTSFANTGVTLRGQTELLQALQNALSESDFDWQGPIHDLLGDYLGPVSAHFLERVFSKAYTTGKKTPAYLAEYLSEEANYLVSRNEFLSLDSELHALREDADRLEAKANKILSTKAE